MKSIIFIFSSLVFILLIGCESVETPAESECNCELTVDGAKESFCGDLNQIKSNFDPKPDMMFIYDGDNYCKFTTNKYLQMNVAYADIKHDITNDYQSHYQFFNYTENLMQANSLHQIDLNQVGGFAFEMWAIDSSYYSSEFGPQIGEIIIDEAYIFNPVESDAVQNYGTLSISSTFPVFLWTQNKTKYIELDVDSLEFTIDLYN